MIKTAIKNFLFPSVDGIVASLTRAVDRLEAHQERSAQKASALRDQAYAHIEQAYVKYDDMHEKANALSAEALKANVQAAKLRGLLA